MALSVKLENDLKDRVLRLADVKQRSSHWIMREAIAEYVSREEARESFYREAMEAWVDYQETGLHLTGQELSAWLSTWGTEAEEPAPRCHV